MLLYVLAVVTLLTALYTWQSVDDAVYQDPGERELAQAILGEHGAALQLCTFPNGQKIWDPTLSAQGGTGTVTQTPGQNAESYPLAGCDSRSGATEITAAMAATAQRAGAAFRLAPETNFATVSMVQSNVLLTFPTETATANGEQGETMAKVAAALYEDVYGNTFRSSTFLGSYDQATQRVRLDNAPGQYLTAPGDTQPLTISTSVIAAHVVGAIPQGAPVLITQLPEAGTSIPAAAPTITVNGSNETIEAGDAGTIAAPPVVQ